VPPPAVALPVQNSPAVHPLIVLLVVDPLVLNADKSGRTFSVVAGAEKAGDDTRKNIKNQRINLANRC
tara:strand:- start:1251 stop:1454 length:204 start_codon:yes stop_codon:yes gene_type:complete